MKLNHPSPLCHHQDDSLLDPIILLAVGAPTAALSSPTPPPRLSLSGAATADSCHSPNAKGDGFKIVVVSGELPSLKFKQYNSIALLPELRQNGGGLKSFAAAGFRVSVFSEYSIDLVVCGGRMCVVLLSEFLESASLRVWGWDEGGECWWQTAAMSPCTLYELYGKKADINCTEGGGKMLVCMNSGEICRYVICDLGENEWEELPHCGGGVNCRLREFVSAFSFEPKIEGDE